MKIIKENYNQDFFTRTQQHIDRVNKYGEGRYPDHDKDKLNELAGDYSLLHQDNLTKEEEDRLNKATLEHISNNPHHPEYWLEKTLTDFDRKNPPQNLDCTRMSFFAMIEMCADWCAMSEEFGNSPFEWADKTIGSRWIFDRVQTNFIYDKLKEMWFGELKSIPYTALDESTSYRLTHGHEEGGYVIMSPCRGKESLIVNLDNSNISDIDALHTTNCRVKELKNRLKDTYSYLPVYGGYKEGENEVFEKSFAIFPYNQKTNEHYDFYEMLNEIIRWAKDWDQESILVKEPDGDTYYLNCDTGEKEVQFSNIKFNDMVSTYFTTMKNKNNRFTFVESYFSPASSNMDSHSRFCRNEINLPQGALK